MSRWKDVWSKTVSVTFLKELFNIPNTMSVFRVLAAPLLAWLWLEQDWRVAGLVLGTIVGLTDQLDGYMARKLNQITDLGGLIDQLGDLVFESTCLLIGILTGHLWSGWLIIYLFREFTVVVIRSYVVGHGGALPSTMIGKVKSSCLQWAFFVLFLGEILIQPGRLPDSWHLVGISPGEMLIWVAVVWIFTGLVLSIISAVRYFKAFAEFYTRRLRQQSAAPAEGKDAS
jgi:CDP-diacylglycerol--glycerol-3-phosphate 3-phosphatidyltransferase